MVLLDQLLILLIKAGVKAYKEHQRAKARASGSGAPSEPSGAPAAPPAARRPTADAQVLLQVARQFAGEPVDDPARAALRRAATTAVIAPAEAGAGGEHLRFLQRLMGALQQLDGQRADPQRAPLLADLDRVAAAYYTPLLQFEARRGIRLSTQHPVAYLGEGSGSLAALMSRSPVAPIEVSAGSRVDVMAWAALAGEVGRDIVLSVDGLHDELRTAAAFPPPAGTLAAGVLDADTVRGALGAWLIDLCADAVGGLIAGPAYLAVLSSRLRSPDEAYRTRVVSAREGRLSTRPPPELRVQVLAGVFREMGLDDEARPLLDAWRDLHGDERDFYFPAGLGRYAAIPEEFYLDPVRDLARVVCRHQAGSLAGMRLLDVPGLHYSLHRHRATLTAVENLRRGSTMEADPRSLVEAAALLGAGDPARRTDTLTLLRRALAGTRPDGETPAADRARTAPVARRESLLSPAVLRDAMVLQGVFRPRRRAV